MSALHFARERALNSYGLFTLLVNGKMTRVYTDLLCPLNDNTTQRSGTRQGMELETNGLNTHFPVPVPFLFPCCVHEPLQA